MIEELVLKGWHVKLLSDHTQPEPCWRCWLSWRKGPLPHKEESCRQPTLDAALTWCETTAKEWKWE
uniref:Uncharacterized protein n=1 Tax=viral metagenome TaxID=1070528 RepID=A0A6M3XY81_9ZZZZ